MCVSARVSGSKLVLPSGIRNVFDPRSLSEAAVKDERCEEALQPAQTPPAFPRTTSTAEPTDQIAASLLRVTAFKRHP